MGVGARRCCDYVAAIYLRTFILGVSFRTIGAILTLQHDIFAAFLPPYKGCFATVAGMTWARAGKTGGL